MKRPIICALYGVAALSLAVGLSGPIERAIDRTQRASSARAHDQRMRSEQTTLQAEFGAKRESIVAEVKSLKDRGDYAAAMNDAARYYVLGDAELNTLYRQSAAAESRRQRLADYRALVQKECNDRAITSATTTFMGTFASAGRAALATSSLRLSRIEGNAALDLVARHLKDEAATPHADTLPEGADSITRSLAAYRARVSPDLARELMDGSVGDDVLCVWQVDGDTVSGKRSGTFELVLWLVPAPTLKGLDFEPISFADKRSSGKSR